jgi:8-oxo-dGTP diphosphatase
MKFEFSAGGVVYKKEKNKNMILIGQHSGHHGWVFPKGIIGDHKKGESKEETALREVEEETGIKGEIDVPLQPVTYWYNFKEDKIKKTVYYFLMKFTGGDTNNHDWEMENVEWIPEDQVEEKLTYKSDKDVWKEARKLLSSI